MSRIRKSRPRRPRSPEARDLSHMVAVASGTPRHVLEWLAVLFDAGIRSTVAECCPRDDSPGGHAEL